MPLAINMPLAIKDLDWREVSDNALVHTLRSFIAPNYRSNSLKKALWTGNTTSGQRVEASRVTVGVFRNLLQTTGLTLSQMDEITQFVMEGRRVSGLPFEIEFCKRANQKMRRNGSELPPRDV